MHGLSYWPNITANRDRVFIKNGLKIIKNKLYFVDIFVNLQAVICFNWKLMSSLLS